MHSISDITSQLDPDFLLEQLHATDQFAKANVEASRGGPFGASLHVIDLDTGERVQVGTLAANAVLKTGIASQHAEAEALSPDNQRALRYTLGEFKKQGKTNVAVLCTSSGQSCPACHAKQEIVARDLVSKGLLEKGKFVVTYGATFEDTAQIAGFNDAPYVLDNIRRLQTSSQTGMVKVEHTHVTDLPEDIKRRLMIAQADSRPIAFLHGANVQIDGSDHRDQDLFASAEVTAIRTACDRQNKQKLTTPWMLGMRDDAPQKEAVLYTAIHNPGPLLLAEAQWAGVSRIVCVGGVTPTSSSLRETPDMANTAFAKALWSGYNRADSYLTVLRVMPYENVAQHAWREKLAREGAAILYNGLASDPALIAYADEMIARFSGHTIMCNVPAARHAPAARPEPTRT